MLVTDMYLLCYMLQTDANRKTLPLAYSGDPFREIDVPLGAFDNPGVLEKIAWVWTFLRITYKARMAGTRRAQRMHNGQIWKIDLPLRQEVLRA